MLTTKTQLHFHVITLFPNVFDSYLEESIIKRAIDQKIIDVSFYNPRSFVKPTKNQKGREKPYLRIDDKPYGGGPGMVMQAEPILKAHDKILSKIGKGKTKRKALTIFLSPGGEQFTTSVAKTFVSTYTDIVIICGRYEGVDARVVSILKAVEVSIGPFVLTGGELPALIIIDTMARKCEGVLGNIESLEEDRSASKEVYTRPEILKFKGKNYKVPPVLLSGNHKDIEAWRAERATIKKEK